MIFEFYPPRISRHPPLEASTGDKSSPCGVQGEWRCSTSFPALYAEIARLNACDRLSVGLVIRTMPRRFALKCGGRDHQKAKAIVSGSEVNRLVVGLWSRRLSASGRAQIDLIRPDRPGSRHATFLGFCTAERGLCNPVFQSRQASRLSRPPRLYSRCDANAVLSGAGDWQDDERQRRGVHSCSCWIQHRF
jgi:hypothetical protein